MSRHRAEKGLFTFAAAIAVLATCCGHPPSLAAAGDEDAAAPAAAPTAAAAPVPSVYDARARFLAGLPVSEDPALAKLTESREWQDHKKALDADWSKLGRRLDKMASWARAEVDPRIDPDRPVIYFFGGPDAITALTFFPDASSYVLAGLEPVGQVAAPERLSDSARNEVLDGIDYALRTAVRASFFRTVEMGRDLTEARNLEIRGVLPILMLFLARDDATILDVQRFDINAASGAVTNVPDGEPVGSDVPGVSITFQRRDATTPQTLTYVRIDLGNESLAKTPGFLTFARQYVPGNALLKAASFILHDNAFSTAREFLLGGAAAVLQEDSGIPFRFLNDGRWDCTCFGNYERPRPPFTRRLQEDLKAACDAQPRRPLQFIIGYRRSDDSSMLLAVKKPATAEAQPAGAQPAGAQPAGAQPAGAQPAEAQPAGTRPAAAQPASASEPPTPRR